MDRVKMIEVLTETATGQAMAAKAEGFVILGLQPARLRFSNGERDPRTMRELRVLLQSERDLRRYEELATACRMVLKEIGA